MANEIQTAPSTTLADNDDWEQELNLRELSMKGYDGISLTEWAAGDTDRPQIAAGSVIEIDGAIAKFTNQTAITDEGGIADGWCYIKFVVSGADVTPTLTNTFGTWDTAKQGFYDGNDRYSLHVMYRSGAVTKIYTAKHLVNPLTVYDEYENGYLVSRDSTYFAGEKIKCKIVEATIAATTQAVITHGISNAYTNHRIIDVRCTWATDATNIWGGEGAVLTVYEISNYKYTNTELTIYRTNNANTINYRVAIFYV